VARLVGKAGTAVSLRHNTGGKLVPLPTRGGRPVRVSNNLGENPFSRLLLRKFHNIYHTAFPSFFIPKFNNFEL